ncbi:hypothetical protein TEA_014966 [Camellia sinensis var. sinensis]|uniref:RRM domain-containing protein n=1 Tax=Camellia sinensis var. sinensis TaxID=542762 RepID=A0A4S4DMX4_CAMSN|nr:hypothetical protein TEA_014966 [Camellia sinensis var. sinensis]
MKETFDDRRHHKMLFDKVVEPRYDEEETANFGEEDMEDNCGQEQDYGQVLSVCDEDFPFFDQDEEEQDYDQDFAIFDDDSESLAYEEVDVCEYKEEVDVCEYKGVTIFDNYDDEGDLVKSEGVHEDEEILLPMKVVVLIRPSIPFLYSMKIMVESHNIEVTWLLNELCFREVPLGYLQSHMFYFVLKRMSLFLSHARSVILMTSCFQNGMLHGWPIHNSTWLSALVVFYLSSLEDKVFRVGEYDVGYHVVAFATFVNHQSAMAALHSLNGVKFDPQTGSVLHIEMARSNSRRKRKPGSGAYVVIDKRTKTTADAQETSSDDDFTRGRHCLLNLILWLTSTYWVPFADSGASESDEPSGANQSDSGDKSELAVAKSGETVGGAENTVAAENEQTEKTVDGVSPCSTLFIANLGPNCTEDELKQFLSQYTGFKVLKVRARGGMPVAFADFEVSNTTITAAIGVTQIYGNATKACLTPTSVQAWAGGCACKGAGRALDYLEPTHHVGVPCHLQELRAEELMLNKLPLPWVLFKEARYHHQIGEGCT